MEEIFPKNTLEKYRNNLFIDLTNALEKQDNELMKISKGMFRKVSSEKNIINHKNKKKSEIDKAFSHEKNNENMNDISLGEKLIRIEKKIPFKSIFLFFTTALVFTGLYFIIKNKNKYY